MPDNHFLNKVKFQHQLLLLVLLPISLMLAVVVGVSNYGLRIMIRDFALKRNTALVTLAAQGVKQDLNGYLRPLTETATTLSRLQNNIQAKQQVIKDLEPFLDAFEGGVTLLDRNGTAIATSSNSQDRMGRSYSFRSYFSEAHETHQIVFSTVLNEIPTGKQAVVIGAPVMNGDQFDGLLIGVLFLRQHPWIDDLGMVQVGLNSQAYLVDKTGYIIYHPQPDLIGKIVDPASQIGELLAEGQPQSTLIPANGTVDELAVSYAPLKGIGWGVIVEEPWKTLLNPVEPYLWASLGILLVGLSVMGVLLFFALRQLLRPILDLADEAGRVSAGETFLPLREGGPPEVRTLIGTFNKMMAGLNEQQAALRRYALMVLRSQEEERQRISRDLHDETVQDLVGLGQRIEMCKLALSRDPSIVRSRLEELQTLTAQAVADVRRMSNDLRPMILDDLGLSAAIQKLCKSLKEDLPDTVVEYSVSGNERRIAPELELVVYRIAQEALNNIRKHARSAASVKTNLVYQIEAIQLIIEDDGPGFELMSSEGLLQQGHLGLAGMIERARLFDGRLSISPKQNQGIIVMLDLPLNTQAVPN